MRWVLIADACIGEPVTWCSTVSTGKLNRLCLGLRMSIGEAGEVGEGSFLGGGGEEGGGGGGGVGGGGGGGGGGVVWGGGGDRPVVNVWSKPKGLPMASTCCPMRTLPDSPSCMGCNASCIPHFIV